MSKIISRQILTLPILLLTLAAAIILLTLLSPEQPTTEPIANRSIYNRATTGYRAWYLTNQKAGFPMRVWEKSFLQLDALPAPATMLMVAPYTVAQSSVIFGKKEASKLLDWVAQGNTLVLLDDFRRFGSNSLAYALMLYIERQPIQPKTNRHKRTIQAVQPVLITDFKKQLAPYLHLPLLSQSELRFGNTRSEYFPCRVLATDSNGKPLIIKISYHQGSLILGTTADLGDNAHLNGPPNDNYQFLSNLLALEKKPIYINEFIHGYMESNDAFSYYQKQTPLGAIFTQFLFGFLVLLWLSFARWTPKPTENSEVDATEETRGLRPYIQSLAGIYYRTQSASLAIEPQLQRINSLLKHRFRISLDEEEHLKHLLGTICASYIKQEGEGAALDPETLLKSLQKAQILVQKQEKHPHRDVLKLAQQLTLLEERLQHDGLRSHPRPHTNSR